jgi:hypothetical protein
MYSESDLAECVVLLNENIWASEKSPFQEVRKKYMKSAPLAEIVKIPLVVC